MIDMSINKTFCETSNIVRKDIADDGFVDVAF